MPRIESMKWFDSRWYSSCCSDAAAFAVAPISSM